MKNKDIIRAWKDAEYRASLSSDEMALLPQNPAGLVELTDEVLEGVVGGADEMASCMCWSCNPPAPTESEL